MSEASDTCLWCDRPAERLCDTLLHVEVVLRRIDELGCEREPVRRLLPLGSLDEIPTCDAPVCASCSTSTPVFDAHPSSYDQRIETLDRCPYCVTQGPNGHLQVEVERHRIACRDHGAKAFATLAAIPNAKVIDFGVRKGGDS